MKKILVIGAGLSASYLINYFLKHAKKENWYVTVADANIELAKKKIGKSKLAHAVLLDINDEGTRRQLISEADIVVSMLPAHLHMLAAHDCLELHKHLVTASYLSQEMKSLHTQALKANLLFLNEIGLDPGIDHLSAMKIIQDIQAQGGEITSFESYCGGLVAPAYDNNPWNYKFTWNPRNVVLAGQATARYLENGLLKFIPPNRIFSQINNCKVGKYNFDAYANRDSLGYIEPYGIGSARTVLRGTLRRIGFCEAWNTLIKLGLTDDTYILPHSENLTYRELICAFISGADNNNLETKLTQFLGITKASKIFKKISWLGLLEPTKIELENATPAQALQKLLQEKWKLNKNDLDQIVMHHQISYTRNKKVHTIHSSLFVDGESQTLTAMAKTVGLPLAIATKLILQGKIKSRGVQIPLNREFYEPILNELETYGIKFIETHK
ncbi:MAG: saccharopine dehydrogenase C-terminal domain-containing protein [bacterium]|nr:saccharopine dehydrogenase C-terminal domain-containing protein [bacterium]